MIGRQLVPREHTELINLEEFVPQDRFLRTSSSLRSKMLTKATTTICWLACSLRSQFFHNRLHLPSQAKGRSPRCYVSSRVKFSARIDALRYN